MHRMIDGIQPGTVEGDAQHPFRGTIEGQIRIRLIDVSHE